MSPVKDAMLEYYQRTKDISLRDHFAGIAMFWYLNNYGRQEDMAVEAYKLADEMLKAREKK